MYQNGQFIDTKLNHEIRPNFTTFDVTYKEGSLMAISYKNNEEIARTILKSSKEVDYIHTNVYTYESLAFIEIELHDQDHTIVSNAKGKLKVDGNILALSSVDTPYNKGFKYKEVDMKDGVALVICEKEDICIHFNSLEKTIHFEK